MLRLFPHHSNAVLGLLLPAGPFPRLEVILSPGGEDMPTLVGGGLVCIFGLLILANFVFQFTVGSRVYAGRRLVWLRSLRGTPTFIRGWQDPDLRRLMILWSILLGVLGLLIAGLVILSIPYN